MSRRTALNLIDAVDSNIASGTADGAYESIAFYDVADVCGDSDQDGHGVSTSTARDRTIKKVSDT